MKLIPLTQGYFAKVDDEDFEYINQFNWHAHKCGKKLYARRSFGVKGKERMHVTLINPEIEAVIDHIDGDGLNNQRHNLRKCTRAENGRNRGANSNAISSYVGVCFDSKTRSHKKWAASIFVNKKKKHLGRFLTEIEAAKERDKASILYFGEFAFINIKEPTN